MASAPPKPLALPVPYVFCGHMGLNPDGSITISTLGDHAEFGHTLTATCEGFGCNRRTLNVTLDDVIRIFGKDWDAIRNRLPIKCMECGSNDISWIVGRAEAEDRKTLGHSQ